MKLEVLTNDVDPRIEEEDGKEWIVMPIRFIKSMNLDKGYVPENEVQDATMRWEGTPIVTDHPQKNGRFVSVDDGSKSVIGEIRNPQSILTNDTVTMGEAWIDPDSIQDEEDKAVLEAIRNKKTLSVSSAYVGEIMPSGEYDGDYREQVRGNLQPDHVAVFEDKDGRCSIEDGCFVGPRADMRDNEVMVNMAPQDTDDPGNSGEDLAGNRETARRPNFSGTTTGEWSAPDFNEYLDALGADAQQVRDLNNSQKSTIAGMTLLGDSSASTFDDLVVFPVVEPESRNLSLRALRAVLSGRGAQADISGRALSSARSVAENLIADNFDVDTSENQSMWESVKSYVSDLTSNQEKEQTMSKKTQELVENGFKEENLPAEGTECFGRIYEQFAANEEQETEGEETEADSGQEGTEESSDEEEVSEPTMDKEDIKEVLSDTLDEKGFVKQENIGEAVTEAIAANREHNEKEELAQKIIANSEKYDEESKDELMDTPKSVLSNMASDLESEKETKRANYSALGSPSANASKGSDSWDVGGVTASELIANQESDD